MNEAVKRPRSFADDARAVQDGCERADRKQASKKERKKEKETHHCPDTRVTPR